MLRALCTITLLTIASFGTANATNLHRLPLAYVPYSITSWMDHNASAGTETRYDGTNISSSSGYYEDGHRGTDFGVSSGTTVYLSATGTVYSSNNTCSATGGYIGNTCGYGFGNYVAVKHADNMVSIYAHLTSVSITSGSYSCVSGPGGTTVGTSGNSGSSSGPHLHYELRINNLAAGSASYDPFGGSWSTQSWDYWYDWAWVSDPLRSGYNMHYPVTTCQ